MIHTSTTYDTHPQLRLRYAILKGTERESRFVDDVETGLKCNCVCPCCGKEVVAKNQGKKKEHHFAHSKGADCAGARMTALHMLAQNVLEEKKQVLLPSYKGTYYQKAPILKTFDHIDLEEICKNEDSTRRPDCIGYNEGKTQNLWIEIYCRHKIDDVKKEDIINRKQYCIEIDFSDLLKTNYTKEEVEKRLIEDSSHSKWICCPKWDEEDKKLREQKEKEIREKKREEEELKNKHAKQEEEHKQKRREYLNKLANQWHSDLDNENTNSIIDEVRHKPYVAEDKLYNYLVPYHLWGNEYKRFPRNRNGLQVFYCLLRYYYEDIRLGDSSQDIEDSMWSLIDKPERSSEEDVLLEYTIIIWVINKLNFYYLNFYENESLCQKLLQNSNFRIEFIKLLLRECKEGLMEGGVLKRIEREYEDKPYKDYIIKTLNICFPQIKEIYTSSDNTTMPQKEQDACNDYQPSQKQLEILYRIEQYRRNKEFANDEDFYGNTNKY